MAGFFNFRPFREDPFFSDHQDRLNNFDDFVHHNTFQQLPGPSTSGRAVEERPSSPSRGLMPFGFSNVFSGFNRAFQQMHDQMNSLNEHPDAVTYSHSSVQTYSKGEDGKPKFFEATSSSRNAPGGIRETRKTVRDSEKEIDKMAVGHHIGDRGHVIERMRNRKTGDQNEKQNFIGMETGQADAFAKEWEEKTRSLNLPALGGSNWESGRHDNAIEDRRSHDRKRK